MPSRQDARPTDCTTLTSSHRSRADCKRCAHAEIKTFYLKNITQQNDANEIHGRRSQYSSIPA